MFLGERGGPLEEQFRHHGKELARIGGAVRVDQRRLATRQLGPQFVKGRA